MIGSQAATGGWEAGTASGVSACGRGWPLFSGCRLEGGSLQRGGSLWGGTWVLKVDAGALPCACGRPPPATHVPWLPWVSLHVLEYAPKHTEEWHL